MWTHPTTTRELYLRFARDEAGAYCPPYADLAAGVAADPDLLDRLDALPAAKRQPNLLLGAVKYHHGAPPTYAELHRIVVADWPRLRATMLARRTQTNEVGRCATLLPVLAALPGPLALLEVGASAGLCLYPDRYAYRYTYADGRPDRLLGPPDGPVRLRCEMRGEMRGDRPGRVDVPDAPPEVVWRGGLDLNPLDPRDPDTLRWLEALVWPGQEERAARLRAAVAIAAAEPAEVLAGDLVERLPDVLARVPAGATLVVFHSAVAAYLDAAGRDRWAAIARGLPGHWVSQEGRHVLPAVADRLGDATGPEPVFVQALDEEPVAYVHPHGAWLDPLPGPPAA